MGARITALSMMEGDSVKWREWVMAFVRLMVPKIALLDVR